LKEGRTMKEYEDVRMKGRNGREGRKVGRNQD
jgi:hypothetical protein